MRRPNVLFLLADDQQFDTIRALGNPAIHTPNLDRPVARGTAFRNAYILPALELIGGFGPAARAAAPALATMAAGTGPVAEAAKKALGKIQPAETKQP